MKVSWCVAFYKLCISGRKRGKTLLDSKETKNDFKVFSEYKLEYKNYGYECVKMSLNTCLGILLAGVKTCL